MNAQNFTYNYKPGALLLSKKMEGETKAFLGSNQKTGFNYYPFGMQLPGRNGTDTYRYGFQGQEEDDEIKGEGNSVNYMYRMHDPRIGRFFAVDPLRYRYPYFSPYQFSGNCVINSVELEGLEGDEKFEIWETQRYAAITKQDYWTAKEQLFGFPTDASMEDIHILLDGFGMIPVIGEVADGINALMYVCEGDWNNAGISTLAIIPVIGETGKVTKYVVKTGDEAVGALKNGEKVEDVTDASKYLKESDLPPACFVAGTKVISATGLVSIEDIEIGDLVWSFNEITGINELKSVDDLFMRDSILALYKLKVGPEVILTTAEHPFYVNGNWIQAKDLNVGDSLKDFDGNYLLVIDEKEIIDTVVTVYNFKVSDNHDYYVTHLGILVHNNSCANPPSPNNLKKVADPNKIPNGCEAVADAVVKHLGDGAQYLQVTSKMPGTSTIGKVNGFDSPWSYHVAAIKDGKVYDNLTGGDGMLLEDYKKMFGDGDVLNFEVTPTRTLN